MDTVISKCHCGSVELELILPNGLENLRRCNCSICSRKNAVVASVAIDNLKVVKGLSKLKEYTFNTHAANTTSVQYVEFTLIIRGDQCRQNTDLILRVSKVLKLKTI